jgi:hypothetical protein
LLARTPRSTSLLMREARTIVKHYESVGKDSRYLSQEPKRVMYIDTKAGGHGKLTSKRS